MNRTSVCLCEWKLTCTLMWASLLLCIHSSVILSCYAMCVYNSSMSETEKWLNKVLVNDNEKKNDIKT